MANHQHQKRSECRGCCVYPHGLWSVLTAVIACVAWILHNWATFHCSFVKIENRGIGLYTFENCYNDNDYYYDYYYDDDCYCEQYDDNHKELFDGPFKSSRAFGLISYVVGLLLMSLMWSTACTSFPPPFFFVMGIMFIVEAFFTTFMMLLFASDICDYQDCHFGAGAGLAVACIVLYCVCAVFCFWTQAKPRETTEQQPSAPHVQAISQLPQQQQGPVIIVAKPGQVTTTERTLPDGTIETTTTTILPDGTQSIQGIVFDAKPTSTQSFPAAADDDETPITSHKALSPTVVVDINENNDNAGADDRTMDTMETSDDKQEQEPDILLPPASPDGDEDLLDSGGDNKAKR